MIKRFGHRSENPLQGEGSQDADASSQPLYLGGSEIQLLIGTFNMGNAEIENIGEWLPYEGEGYDVIAIGLQESTFKPVGAGPVTDTVDASRSKGKRGSFIEPSTPAFRDGEGTATFDETPTPVAEGEKDKFFSDGSSTRADGSTDGLSAKSIQLEGVSTTEIEEDPLEKPAPPDRRKQPSFKAPPRLDGSRGSIGGARSSFDGSRASGGGGGARSSFDGSRASQRRGGAAAAAAAASGGRAAQEAGAAADAGASPGPTGTGGVAAYSPSEPRTPPPPPAAAAGEGARPTGAGSPAEGSDAGDFWEEGGEGARADLRGGAPPEDEGGGGEARGESYSASDAGRTPAAGGGAPGSAAGSRRGSMQNSSRFSVSRFVGDHTGYKRLKTIIESHLGSDFRCVGKHRRGQMQLRVYVRRALASQVSGVQIDAENTGIGHILANKGGLVCKLQLGHTTLCFVSCHLEAHEGGQHLVGRNLSCKEILLGTKVGRRHMDAATQFHHVFWFGDLNYRTDFSLGANLKGARRRKLQEQRAAEAEAKGEGAGEGEGEGEDLVPAEDWSQQWKRLQHMIKNQDYASIYKYDELQRELAAEEVLWGFQTSQPNFPPTFKVARHKTLEYNPKRLPSYCDRVLWKSLPGVADLLRLTAYEACPGTDSSDHKPVRAAFAIRPTWGGGGGEPDGPHRFADLRAASSGGRAALELTELRGEGLEAMDYDVMGGKSDPYIVFHLDPPTLLHHTLGVGVDPKTKTVKRTVNPKWEEPQTLSLNHCTEATLRRSHLLMVIMDKDFMNPDDFMGAAVLPLKMIFEQEDAAERQEEDRPRMPTGGTTSGPAEEGEEGAGERAGHGGRSQRATPLSSLSSKKRAAAARPRTVAFDLPVQRGGRVKGRLRGALTYTPAGGRRAGFRKSFFGRLSGRRKSDGDNKSNCCSIS